MKLNNFCFWKLDLIPETDNVILNANVNEFGSLKDILSHLLDIPKTSELPNDYLNLARVWWDIESGAILRINVDESIKPGKIINIYASTGVSYKCFYRLYVQIYENFGAIVYVDDTQKFIHPKEFRKLYF
jgi:hypothetical protein